MTRCKFARLNYCGNYDKNSYTCNADQGFNIDTELSYCGIYNDLERANKNV